MQESKWRADDGTGGKRGEEGKVTTLRGYSWLHGVDKGLQREEEARKGGNPEIRGTGVKCSSPVFLPPNTLL